MIGTNWDVTEARTLVDELRQEKDLAADAAAHDALTGLFNRRGIQTWIDSRPEPCATLLYLDLDGFKAINDRAAMPPGIKRLCVVARIIKDAVRGIDACARVGGDEFLVVLLGEIRPEETRTIVWPVSALRWTLPATIGSKRRHPHRDVDRNRPVQRVPTIAPINAL